MAGRFDRQIDSAKKLIKKNGQLVKWVSVTKSVTDDFKEVETKVEHLVWVCFVTPKNNALAFLAYLQGKELKSGNVLGLMAGDVPFNPDLVDYVERDGNRLELVKVNLVSPNGQKILYKVEFKQ